MTGIEEPTLDEIPAEPRDLPGPELIPARTIEQIERDLLNLFHDVPVGDPPAIPAPRDELIAYYRRSSARAEREKGLWRELIGVLPSETAEWALLAAHRANDRAVGYAWEIGCWIRDAERRPAE